MSFAVTKADINMTFSPGCGCPGMFCRKGNFMIKLSHIRKTFRVARRDAGFTNAVKSFFVRKYDKIEALSDVSFEINDGEMVGYIGPNGAGKSSTIKVMSGILTPDSGECVIDGRTPWLERKAHVANLGVVFGQRSALWWDVPVIDSFELLRDIYSVPPEEYSKNVQRLTELLDLGNILRTPTRQLSLGQRMRCEIAAALIHSPRILFLDEPTIGLDAVSKLAVREFVCELNRERGTTVILTTHDMQDIEALTSRIILIGKGKILLDGELEALKHRFEGNKTVVAEYSGSLNSLPDGVEILDDKSSGNSHRTEFALNDCAVSKLISVLASSVELNDVSVKSATIDETIVRMYKEYGI